MENGASEMVTNLATSVVSMVYNFQLMKMFGENGIAAYGIIMYESIIFTALNNGTVSAILSFLKTMVFEVASVIILPMILGKDKKKLSKRQGATSVFEYNDLGYLPDGVFNFLALLGWSPRSGEEIFSRAEAVELFDIKNVTRKPAVLDIDKLNHINQEQMKRMAPEKLLEVIRPFWIQMGLPVDKFGDDYLAASLKTMGGRGQTTIQVAEYSDYFLDFAKVQERYDGGDIKEELRPKLKKIYGELLTAWGDGTPEHLHEQAQTIFAANESSMKESATPMRWALTGRKVSPGVFEVASQLGKEETKKRLEFYGLV